MALPAKRDAHWWKKMCVILSALTERYQTRLEVSREVFEKMQAVSPRICLSIRFPMACKERYNLCMNRALFDLESLNCEVLQPSVLNINLRACWEQEIMEQTSVSLSCQCLFYKSWLVKEQSFLTPGTRVKKFFEQEKFLNTGNIR